MDLWGKRTNRRGKDSDGLLGHTHRQKTDSDGPSGANAQIGKARTAMDPQGQTHKHTTREREKDRYTHQFDISRVIQ